MRSSAIGRDFDSLRIYFKIMANYAKTVADKISPKIGKTQKYNIKKFSLPHWFNWQPRISGEQKKKLAKVFPTMHIYVSQKNDFLEKRP